MSLYRVVGWILRIALGFYFRRIERFHLERVPQQGPALFVSNHPNSVTDAFVIGASVGRKVHFVATVQLFGLRPIKWLLERCGVIPINRVQDDPRAMRSVLQTFEACFRVLERGEAVAIFPEGITHDDPQLKTVKTGPARMALELEHRHGGGLGLVIVPVGLTFSAKEKYRSEVLVHFGESIRVADYLAGYPEQRRDAIQRLSAAIEQRLQGLILHIPELQRARVVAAVKRLYLQRLRLGNLIVEQPLPPHTEELVLTQAIADAVNYTFREHPDRVAAFVRKLDRYERWLQRLHLSDEDVERFTREGTWGWRGVSWAMLAVLGAPVALYGQVHRAVPVALVKWSVNRFASVQQFKARVSTTAILAGIVSFGLFYGALVWACRGLFGWPVAVGYGLSLPVAGLVAHSYVRELRRLATGLRNSALFIRLRLGTPRLLKLRCELIAEIESVRAEYREHLQVAGSIKVPQPTA
jgi:1-acyl-sn-glycerol-3-phosphate acyltransferase